MIGKLQIQPPYTYNCIFIYFVIQRSRTVARKSSVGVLFFYAGWLTS